MATSSLPLDGAGRATKFRLWSLTSPHMRAFHLAWFSLFTCFFSTFSIPPLIPVIRSDLGFSSSTISTAASASFLGSIFSRLAMGPTCDILGPTTSSAILSFLTAPAILATSLVSSPASFILVRFFVGFSLANFVANQYWMSCMFAGNVVGLANGLGAGWANVGGGVAQLLMPVLYTCLLKWPAFGNFPHSWRFVFIFPTVLQIFAAVLVLLYGQDLPSGKFTDRKICEDTGDESKEEDRKLRAVLAHGLSNYRGWILALLYGYSFGVELTMDNIIAQYFYDRFGVDLAVAGTIAACFGMSNLFSRPMGGVISDAMGRAFGMRGRLWGLWVVQTVAGLFCVLLGRLNSIWSSVAIMWVFSIFIQAASGLIFGIVPFVSKRSLGVISGMTGSGGTLGAVVTQFLLFSGDRFSKATSISLMGLLTIIATLSATLLYFPQWGSMFFRPRSTDVGRMEENGVE